MPIRKEINELLENGKTTKALKAFTDYAKEHREDLLESALRLSDRNKENRNNKTLDRISEDHFEHENKSIRSEFLFLIEKLSQPNKSITDLDSVLINKKIFLAYHQHNKKIAEEMKEMLGQHGAIDIIELEQTPNDCITELLHQKIKESQLTISIIAARPLEAAWFGLDIIHTFSKHAQLHQNFIGLYLDSDFFDWRYQMENTVKLSNRIKELEHSLKKGLELGERFIEIDNEKKRLLQLKTNLGTILSELKEATLFDIGGNSLKKNISQIIKTIKK